MKWSKKKKKRFSLFWRATIPEPPLCWQNTEKVTPRLYSRSILYGNRGPIWLISAAAVCSQRKAGNTLETEAS